MLSEIFPIHDPVIVLVGPTAIGKTKLSLTIARRYNCEIISLDSMQVYRYMDIGTAKATAEERALIPHHLIDVVDPDGAYDASSFTSDALKAVIEIHGRGKVPLVTGGTGLYLRSLIEGLFDDVGSFPQLRGELAERLREKGNDELHQELRTVDSNSAERIHPNDTQRLLRALEIYYATGTTWTDHLRNNSLGRNEKRFCNILQIGLTCKRDILYKRINQRSKDMLTGGLKEEVEQLVARGYDRSLKSMQSIGYRHMISHLFDGWSHEKTESILSRDTRRYAKRQYTWFRKMDIKWYQVENHSEIFNGIDKFLA